MSGYISGEADDRRPAQHHDLAGGMGARGNVVDLRRLHVHAADHDDVGPFEFGGGRLADVLVDEADRPVRRHIGRDQQQTLRRHEGAHALHQPIGMIEGAEGRGVVRENAQYPPLIPDWDRRAHATSDPMSPWSLSARRGRKGSREGRRGSALRLSAR